VVHQRQDEQWLAAAVQCLVPPSGSVRG
jgi:hypothetical protein